MQLTVAVCDIKKYACSLLSLCISGACKPATARRCVFRGLPRRKGLLLRRVRRVLHFTSQRPITTKLRFQLWTMQ